MPGVQGEHLKMMNSAVQANWMRLILPADIWMSPMAGNFIVDHHGKKTRTVSLLDTKTSMVNIFADFIEKTKRAISGSLIRIIVQKRTRNKQ